MNARESEKKDKEYEAAYIALREALIACDADRVTRILESKAITVFSPNDTGWTAIHMAARYSNAKCLQIIIDAGASVNAKKEDDWTPLHLAANAGSIFALELLLKKNADVHALNNEKLTPLACAVAKNNVCFARLLLEAGSDVNFKYDNSESLLYRAVKNQNLKLVKLLLEYQADTKISNKDGYAPIHIAARKGNSEIVTQLTLKKNADPNAKSDKLKTPLHLAAEFGHVKVVELLLQDPDVCKLIDFKCAFEGSAIHYAAQKGHFNIVKLLLENHANPNAKGGDESSTPLMLAAYNGHDKVVDALLENPDVCKSINERNNSGATALYFAAKFKHPDIVERLIKAGADIDIPTNSGLTPLKAAAKTKGVAVSKSDQVANLLLAAKLNKPNDDKKQTLLNLLNDPHEGQFNCLMRLLTKDEYNNLFGNNLECHDTNLKNIKNRIYYYIKSQNTADRLHLCILALDKSTALGALIHLQRGGNECDKSHFYSTAWWINQIYKKDAAECPNLANAVRDTIANVGKRSEAAQVEQSPASAAQQPEPAAQEYVPDAVTKTVSIYPQQPIVNEHNLAQVQAEIDRIKENSSVAAHPISNEAEYVNPFSESYNHVSQQTVDPDPLTALEVFINLAPRKVKTLLEQLDGEDIFAAPAKTSSSTAAVIQQICSPTDKQMEKSPSYYNPFDNVPESQINAATMDMRLFTVPKEFNLEKGQQDLIKFFDDVAPAQQPDNQLLKQKHEESRNKKIAQKN